MFWALLNLGFEVLDPFELRARGSGSFGAQGSRFWVLLGLGFEVLGSFEFGVRSYGPF